MLTVWCVCVGDKYSDADVYALRDMVANNLDQHYVFRCLSDRPIPGIYCLVLDEAWPGWWSKLLLFKHARGPNLYLDLDVVVVGNLARLLSKPISMPLNWGQSGHGGCQSSVMSWGQSYPDIARQFDINQLHAPERGNCGAYGAEKLWGDQEFITDLMGNPGEGEIVPMQGVYSYKYHCRQSLPDDAVVVCFHGQPKPNEVRDEWVLKARSSTATAA